MAGCYRSADEHKAGREPGALAARGKGQSDSFFVTESRYRNARRTTSLRQQFLSQMIFQTFNGYAMSQFKKIEQDLRNSGEIKWKHATHLLRLLLTGAATLRNARVPVRVQAHRDRLLAVKRGEMPWTEVDAWRKELHRDFERALAETKLPERPDYEAANCFLIKARREIAKSLS
jgi:hypothetical protein